MLEEFSLSNFGDSLGLQLSNVTLRGPSEAIAFSTAPLVGMFADEDNPILIMSTGLASDVILPNRSGDQGTDLGLEGGINDDIVLTFDVTKEASDNFLSFDLTFLTEEFPEFIGADFNDFFSATVNGVETALDLNGAVMDVNSAFFDPDLPTDGTQFDGRTATVRVTTQLDASQTVNTVELRIADEGDGRFDSAAFLNEFRLSSHAIFVDFGAGEADFDTLFEDGFTFATEAADLTPDEIDQIMNGFPNEDDDNIDDNEDILGVRDIFDGFAVEFVLDRPDFENYSTIHVGGRFEDLPSVLQGADDTLISLSEAIDLGNEDDRDEAIVFADEAVEVTDSAAKIGLLAQTIAREAAHLVGLRNVEDRNAVVFPAPGESRTDLTSVSQLAALDDEGDVIAFPTLLDLTNELNDTIGVIGPAVAPVDPLSDVTTQVLTLEFGATTPTLNDVRVATVDLDNNILDLVRLETIGAEDVVNLILPVIGADRIVLIGSTAAGEDPDLFLTTGDVDDVSLTEIAQADVFDEIGVAIGDLISGEFQIAPTAEADELDAANTVRTNLSALPVLQGGDGADSLEADFLGGVLIGLGGDDTLDGDKAADGLYGGDGDDLVLGGDGDDDIRGADGDDALEGGDGNDMISGGAGADSLFGGAGLDTLFAGAGDVVVGGDGFDVALIEANFSDQTLTAEEDEFVFTSAQGVLRVSEVESFQFSDQSVSEQDLEEILAPVVEEPEDDDPLTAGDGGEEITGGDAPETVTGGAGEDSLSGGGGGDNVSGGGGDDSLTGDAGGDTLRGGEGADEMSGGGGRDRLIGGAGDDRLQGGAQDDTLIGGSGADVLIGGFGADLLRGGGGDDQMNGGGGRDDIRGGGGADLIRGGGGRDDIRGGGGADVINGGRGADVIRGGGGSDTFQYTTGDGRDVIRDFRQGVDTIEILRGATEFDDLFISQLGADVRIAFSNVTIIIQTDNVNNFTEADFIF